MASTWPMLYLVYFLLNNFFHFKNHCTAFQAQLDMILTFSTFIDMIGGRKFLITQTCFRWGAY